MRGRVVYRFEYSARGRGLCNICSRPAARTARVFLHNFCSFPAAAAQNTTMTTTPGALSALVVGGASGIGEATARKLASRGITVCIADCNVDQAKIVAAAVVRDFDVRAEVVYVDVGEEESIRAAVDHAAHMTGRLDFAANCAGICESVWDEEISISSEVFDRYII